MFLSLDASSILSLNYDNPSGIVPLIMEQAIKANDDLCIGRQGIPEVVTAVYPRALQALRWKTL